MVTSLKGLNVGGATHEKRPRVGERKKKKSQVEVEPKPSAAVPCHIFAEHDSRTIWCGNDLGFSLSRNTNKAVLRVFSYELGYRRKPVSDRGEPRRLMLRTEGDRSIYGD